MLANCKKILMAHIYSGLIDDAAFLVFFFKNNLDDDGGGDGDNNDDGKNTLRGIFMKDAVITACVA